MMPDKNRKVFSRPITSYLGTEGDTEGEDKGEHEDTIISEP